MDNIIVSVVCITYNHEKYIRDALDGFVMQKTNFKFEVIVHDDASTDETARIIEEYAKKYDFIKPILQLRNQYCRNKAIVQTYVYPVIQGEYVAYCEGDDYWTDEHKLQKLVDYMQANPDCSVCCHAYNNIRQDGKKVFKTVALLEGKGDITAEQIISFKLPPQLASVMVRRVVLSSMPDFCSSDKVGVGDYPLLLYALTLGKCHYLPDNMSNHRIACEGSWTERVSRNEDPTLAIEHNKRMLKFLQDFDIYTSGQYSNYVSSKIDEIKLSLYELSCNFKDAKKCATYSAIKWHRRAIIAIGCYFPNLAQKMSRGVRKIWLARHRR